MDDREELRRLIDVIEKGSGSGSLEQAVDDIKTFANTVSFLANKLDARLKSKDVAAKKPKSRIGKAIAPPPMPRPNRPQQQAPQIRPARVCLHPYHHRRHKLTLTGSSRRAANEQSQHRKQWTSYSAYKRRVGADLSASAARVTISAGWVYTRCLVRNRAVFHNMTRIDFHCSKGWQA